MDGYQKQGGTEGGIVGDNTEGGNREGDSRSLDKNGMGCLDPLEPLDPKL